MPRGSHRVVSAGVRCSFESGHKQDDHALTLRAISGSMHRKKMYRISLFDHLVGAGEQRWWHVEPERLAGFEVDYEIKLRRLLDGNICRVCPTENPIGELSSAAKKTREVRPVGHQTSPSHEFTNS